MCLLSGNSAATKYLAFKYHDYNDKLEVTKLHLIPSTNYKFCLSAIHTSHQLLTFAVAHKSVYHYRQQK
jgi:hypothetical protein